MRYKVKLTWFILIFFPIQLQALHQQIESSAYHHLLDVNALWINHLDDAPDASVRFTTDKARISYHLKNVIRILRTTDHGYSELKSSSRLSLLDALEEYAQKKVFPRNLYHHIKTPYFIDDRNVHCAVGYLIMVSGNDELAQKISQTYNYDYIENIPEAELSNWADSYGFTVAELKWIQPQYDPKEVFIPLGQGTNGPVAGCINDYYNERLVIAGQFSEIGGEQCMNIGQYKNGNLSCLGNGIDGKINKIILYDRMPTLFGSFEFEGTNYPIAFWDEQQWQYLASPWTEGTEASCGYTVYGDLYVALVDPGLPNQTRVYLLEDNNWVKLAELNGSVLTMGITSWNNTATMMFCGNFDGATSFSDQGSANVNARNVLTYAVFYGEFEIIDDVLPDTIKSILRVGEAIYFGGASPDSSEGPFLSRVQNGTSQTMLNKDNFAFERGSINEICYYENSLFLGGEFKSNAFGTASNILKYDLSLNVPYSPGRFNGPLTTIINFGNQLIVAGDFSKNMNASLPNIGRLDESAGLDPLSLIDARLGPNPLEDNISIYGVNGVYDVRLYNLQGQMIKRVEAIGVHQIYVGDLSLGIYFIEVHNADGYIRRKLVKS